MRGQAEIIDALCIVMLQYNLHPHWMCITSSHAFKGWNLYNNIFCQFFKTSRFNQYLRKVKMGDMKYCTVSFLYEYVLLICIMHMCFRCVIDLYNTHVQNSYSLLFSPDSQNHGSNGQYLYFTNSLYTLTMPRKCFCCMRTCSHWGPLSDHRWLLGESWSKVGKGIKLKWRWDLREDAERLFCYKCASFCRTISINHFLLFWDWSAHHTNLKFI